MLDHFLASKELAEEAGFKVFNDGDHLCVDATEPENFTISVKLPGAKQVTFAFCAACAKEDFECVDLHLEHPLRKRMGGGGKEVPAQKVLMFDPGGNGTASVEGTLPSLMLADSYYEVQQNGNV